MKRGKTELDTKLLKIMCFMFYLDLLPSWIKGCVQKMFGKTLHFSYFYFVYGNVLNRLIMKN